MRRTLLCLLATAFLTAAALPISPTAAEPPKAQLSAADFASAYQRWLEIQDGEEAIALGEQLLAAESGLKSWPLTADRALTKAEIQFATGSTYVMRPRGVRADNLEKGIALLEAALLAFTRERDPQNWARAHNNLGIAYWGRIRGERAENHEKAIAHFEAAVTVLTREAASQEWAQAQNNLAIVYFSRVRGERSENVEKAIAQFQAALTVFTLATNPQAWASAHNNLGSAYKIRIAGERADNREKAIEHIEATLSVFTREATPREWAQTQNNLGAAYVDRIEGERAENQEKAIGCFEAALSVFTRETYPYEWATTQRSVGNAYSDRLRGDHSSNRQKAIAAYEAALTVFTREAAPLEHLRTARNLGASFVEARDWAKATQAYASAREAFLLLFGQGLEEDEARALISDAGPLFAEAAFVAVQNGQLESALQLADEGRARMLAVSMKMQSLELPAAQRQRLDALKGAIRAAQQAADAAGGDARAAALDKLAQLRREALEIVKGAAARTSDSAIAQARAIINGGSAIAVPIVTSFGGKILVMVKSGDGKGLSAIDLPELTPMRLSRVLIGPEDAPPAGWIAAYFINYVSRDEQRRRWPEWLAAIEGLGPELWGLVGAQLDTALKKQGIKSGTRLVWLPSGWLGILPLGLAQDPGSKRRLADDYEIAYSPSLEALAAAQRSLEKTGPATLAAIINPTGDLPGTEKEGAIVASHFASGARTLLQRQAATPDAVLAALKGKTHWHFASHGTFSWQDARMSALVMQGGARLNVGRLLEANGLGHPRLVVLSACETGLNDITRSPDEFVGLPGTFTALGAAGVLGTLWPVNDAATALLMAKFYELHMDGGLAPPTALRQAQAWLRGATNADLNAYAKTAAAQRRIEARHLSEIEGELKTESEKRSTDSAASRGEPASGATGSIAATASVENDRPYAHPYYWAGFIHTGL